MEQLKTFPAVVTYFPQDDNICVIIVNTDAHAEWFVKTAVPQEQNEWIMAKGEVDMLGESIRRISLNTENSDYIRDKITKVFTEHPEKVEFRKYRDPSTDSQPTS